MEKKLDRAMSKHELASMYGVSYKTLNSWLKPFNNEIGPYLGRAFRPSQIRMILKLLGEP